MVLSRRKIWGLDCWWQCQRPWCSFRAHMFVEVCRDCVQRESRPESAYGVMLHRGLSGIGRPRLCDKRGPIFTQSHTGKQFTLHFHPTRPSIVVHNGHFGQDERYDAHSGDMHDMKALIGEDGDVREGRVVEVDSSGVTVSCSLTSRLASPSFLRMDLNVRMRVIHTRQPDVSHEDRKEEETKAVEVEEETKAADTEVADTKAAGTEAADTEVEEEEEEEEEETNVAKKRRREEEVVLPFVKIKLLKELKDDGAITDKEFEEKKRELLARV